MSLVKDNLFLKNISPMPRNKFNGRNEDVPVSGINNIFLTELVEM
jgi:hypothetical protein